MNKKQQIYSGKIKKLWPYLAKLHRENPDVFDDPDFLFATVASAWTDLKNPKQCPNCGESMQEYVHKLDFFNALLLKEMGDVVKKRLQEGMPLTEANQVHVVSQDFHDCVRHRTTQCRTLGLIAKVQNEDGSHDRTKGWLITRRGFQALRGEPVPAEVAVFRNKITERSDITTTLDEVFASCQGENASLVGSRDPRDWVHFGNIHQGTML